MIHTLFYVALYFLSLFIAWNLSAANEQIRVQRVLRSALDEGDPRRRSVAGRGAPDASRHGADLSAPDSATVEAEPSPSSSVYDGQAEAALAPRPLLSVVEGLEERPGLRVVDS